MEDLVDCPLAAVLAKRLHQARDDLTRRWLERIVARVTIDPNHVFPTDELLDHVPLLVDGIADYIEDPADEIGAHVPVIAKARELGALRQAQGFSVYEILKEYEILGGVLFSFLIGSMPEVDEECSPGELLACGQRLFRAIAVIQQATTTHFLHIADEAVHEREERLRSFNRMVTHELKNQISAVQGAAALLLEPDAAGDSGQRAKLLEVIDRNARGMDAILRDLLSLSRTDADSRQQRHVRLPEAAREASRQLREMAQQREVRVELAADLPDVEVDAAAIELCLVNLLSNAIKYSDPRKSQRWVHVSATMAQGDLTIAVDDNGIGVPPASRRLIFDQFHRAHKDPDVDGSGLGLSIVKETVERAGGRVWAEFKDDASGGGTTFRLSIPARRSGDRTEDAEQNGG